MMVEIDDFTIKKAAHDKKSFKKVYDYYMPYVWRTAYRIANGDRDSAENITQESFIKVFRSLKKFGFNSSFSTWLFRIVYNTSMTHLKRKQSEKIKMNNLSENMIVKENSDRTEEKDIIKSILSSLSEEERFLLITKEVEGFSFDKIAEMTGKKTGSLRTRLHRIKEKIKSGVNHNEQV